jgi:hypothetical protein
MNRLCHQCLSDSLGSAMNTIVDWVRKGKKLLILLGLEVIPNNSLRTADFLTRHSEERLAQMCKYPSQAQAESGSQLETQNLNPKRTYLHRRPGKTHAVYRPIRITT